VVKLNRAVAIAMSERPEQGLRLVDELLSRGELVDYHLAHSARRFVPPDGSTAGGARFV
jgi:RNA polymerase sigma-70 factor (ECF subfamily)